MSHMAAIEKKHATQTEDRAHEPVIDMHMHIVDFLQKTDGLSALLKQMDAANIDKSVIFGLPVKKKWESFEPHPPFYYLDDNAPCYYYGLTDEVVAEQYLALSKQDQKRFAPMICGFNPTDCLAIDHLEYIYNKYPIWKGVGELLLRHDDLTNLTMEEVARINHKALEPIFQFCIDRQLPLMIHQNVTSVGIHDHFEYLHELRHVLTGFPKLNLVWAHCGISRRIGGKDYFKVTDALLNEFSNLKVDIAWVVFDDVICDPDNNDLPKAEWVQLIEENPNRFMVGSDLCGHFDSLGKTIARYNKLFSMLSPTTVAAIAHGNAQQLWFDD